MFQISEGTVSINLASADAVAAVNPFLRRIPKNLQERYLLDSCIELQKLKTPSVDSSTTARYRLMIAHARRPAEWVDPSATFRLKRRLYTSY